ncbi:MAG: glycosyltransferase family 4 protein [Planctomycetia bacterium]|nr:glycosyltransferase family 4 protein [Planctomycetia bacterium]
MQRSPADCGFRTPLGSDRHSDAHCGLVERALGVTDRTLSVAPIEACEACCRSLLHGELINPVIASLVYNAVSHIVSKGGHPQCSSDRAQLLKQKMTDRLSFICDDLPDCMFPPAAATAGPTTAPQIDRSSRRSQPLTWVVGLLTAPRRKPVIRQTLESLRLSGFDQIHIFAEPQSELPAADPNLTITVHERRLGNFLNFYSSLTRLLTENPSTDAFAVFQDDIQLARGLRQWCDEQFWPLQAAVVSLFTPRLHSDRTVGWRLLSPGSQRVCGAQSLVFRRDALQRFLTDPQVIVSLQHRDQNDDAVVAAWAAREGTGIAYHTPSLVQHVGEVSSLYAGGPDRRNFAHAVPSVDQIAGWRRTANEASRIGLVGWNTPTGLGYQNRDLAVHGRIDRWLVPRHPSLAGLDRVPGLLAVESTSLPPSDDRLRAWMEGLDWIVFIERPYLDNLPRVAAHSGVGVACVANWEWVQPELHWLGFVDVMLCPTKQTFLQMTDWKRRHGFGWETVYVPWPIDTDRFPFQLRRRCQRFLFVNGWGGGPARRLDGSPTGYGRKGLELIVETARLAPQLRFVVRSQIRQQQMFPANIDDRPATADNVDLYREGDVCVQPSHFEGLGLQLLECQAAGMPLVTTDAAPMHEYEPFRTIPVRGTEVIEVGGGPILSQLMDPRDLVATLENLQLADITDVSRRAREYVERNHSWSAANEILRRALVKR